MKFAGETPKKATNVSVNADILKAARSRKINLSATLEAALIAKLQICERQEWADSNSQALDEYADHVDKNGVFSDGLRRF